MIKVAILGSTRGTSSQAIFEAVAAQQIPATIEVVISNKDDAQILARATYFGVPTKWIDPTGLSREAFDAKVTDILEAHDVDLIVLVGYLRILSKAFVDRWQNQIINVHPSLLPAFAGMMDLAVHEAVLAADKAETGCTVHVVTEEVDAGPIIVQKTCQVLASDTPETLKARVQALEGEALVEAITTIHEGGLAKPMAPLA